MKKERSPKTTVRKQTSGCPLKRFHRNTKNGNFKSFSPSIRVIEMLKRDHRSRSCTLHQLVNTHQNKETDRNIHRQHNTREVSHSNHRICTCLFALQLPRTQDTNLNSPRLNSYRTKTNDKIEAPQLRAACSDRKSLTAFTTNRANNDG